MNIIDKDLLEFLKALFVLLSKAVGYGMLAFMVMFLAFIGIGIVVTLIHNKLSKPLVPKWFKDITNNIWNKFKTLIAHILNIWAILCILWAIYDIFKTYIIN